MPRIFRVLDPKPCTSLTDYIATGGGDALHAARLLESGVIIDTIRDSGLRGRGGAGFPTATKWTSVLENSPGYLTPVIINGAEGEPSTFKDRTILRSNPYRVLEGALIGCAVLNSSELVVCLKESFTEEWDRVSSALAEMRLAGRWLEEIGVRLVAGPSSYLFGEETAMLEVISGRHPFPRVTPPWRRGLDKQTETSAEAVLAGPDEEEGTPALVNNVETFANITLIIRNGAAWFREIGTAQSPGSMVCTVSGDCVRSAVGEFALGTPLIEVLTELGGGARPGRNLVAVLPGASSAVVSSADFDVPLTYEAFRDIGSGLGSAGFRCIDDLTNPIDFAYGVSRFLSVESCGQCTPCKDDGLAVTQLLGAMLDGASNQAKLNEIDKRLETITGGARCSLASQQQVVIRSILDHVPSHTLATPLEPDEFGSEDLSQASDLFAPIVKIVEGTMVVDETHQHKQPDWSYNDVDSGEYPVQRLTNTAPVPTSPPKEKVLDVAQRVRD